MRWQSGWEAETRVAEIADGRKWGPPGKRRGVGWSCPITGGSQWTGAPFSLIVDFSIVALLTVMRREC